MSSTKRIFKAVATVTIFAVVTRTLSFLFKIYLSRALGAEVVGLYQICLSTFFLFSSLGASGVPTVLSRKIAEDRALNSESKGYAQFSTALILGILVSLGTIIILFLLRPYLGALFSDTRAVPLFYIMLPALLSTCVYSIIRAWFWGSKEFTYFSVTETVEEVLRIVFTALFVSGLFAGASGAYGIALAFTISDLTVAVILIILYIVKGGKVEKPRKISEIAKPALPVTAMRVFGSLIATILAIMLPARLIAAGYSVADATASFGRIAGMANPLLLAPNAIIASMTIVLVPEMSESGVKNNMIMLNRQVCGGINFALVISGVFMVAFAALGRELTSFLFADIESGKYLEAASCFMLVMPINMITTSTLNSIGMEKQSFFSYCISAVFMLAAIYVLPKYMGIYSVVVANAAALVICACGNMYYLRKRANLSFGFLKTTVMVASIAVPCVFFSKWIHSLLVGPTGIFALFAALAAGAVMYALFCYIFGLINVESIMQFRKLKRPQPAITQTPS